MISNDTKKEIMFLACCFHYLTHNLNIDQEKSQQVRKDINENLKDASIEDLTSLIDECNARRAKLLNDESESTIREKFAYQLIANLALEIKVMKKRTSFKPIA